MAYEIVTVRESLTVEQLERVERILREETYGSYDSRRIYRDFRGDKIDFYFNDIGEGINYKGFKNLVKSIIEQVIELH